jgi:hypothetical protein
LEVSGTSIPFPPELNVNRIFGLEIERGQKAMIEVPFIPNGSRWKVEFVCQTYPRHRSRNITMKFDTDWLKPITNAATLKDGAAKSGVQLKRRFDFQLTGS